MQKNSRVTMANAVNVLAAALLKCKANASTVTTGDSCLIDVVVAHVKETCRIERLDVTLTLTDGQRGPTTCLLACTTRQPRLTGQCLWNAARSDYES